MQRRWPAVLAVAAVLCACGQPVDGVAVAGVPGIAEQFDPCSIPDDAIAATGLDPGKKMAGWGEGIRVADWTTCGWKGPRGDSWYQFDVLFSVVYSMSDVRTNRTYLDVSEVQIGERHGLQFRFEIIEEGVGCDAAFDTKEGIVRLSVRAIGGIAPRSDPCQEVLRHSSELERYFPPSP